MSENEESQIMEPEGDLTLEYIGLYYYAQLQEALSQLVFEEQKVRTELRSVLMAETDLKKKLKDIELLLKDDEDFKDYMSSRAMFVEQNSKIDKLMDDMDRQ